MDDRYKIGSGSVGQDDFAPVDGTSSQNSTMGAPAPIAGLSDQPIPQANTLVEQPVTTVVESDKSKSGEPLSMSDSYLSDTTVTTPDFLNDQNYYGSNVPDFLQSDQNGGVITTFVPDKEKIEEEKKEQKKIEKATTVNEDYKVDYNYTPVEENQIFNYQIEPSPTPTPVVTEQRIETFRDPLSIQENYTTENKFTTTYEETKKTNPLNWLGALLIVFICLILTAFLGLFARDNLGIFNSGNIAGLSNTDLRSEVLLLSDEIDKYFELIKSEYVYEQVDTEVIYSEKPPKYWLEVFEKGGILKDKIDKLQTRLDSEINGREIEEDTELDNFRNYLASSEEYVNVHYRTSEMFIYLERGLNMISRDIKMQDDLLDNIQTIDDLRAGLQNVKGEISDELKTTTELKKSKILDYYYQIFNNYFVKLGSLKQAISFESETVVKNKLNELLSVYSEDMKYIEETRFYVDYTTQDHVKYVINLKNQDSQVS